MDTLLFPCSLLLFFQCALSSKNPISSTWVGRSVYFVVTDRFASSNPSLPPCIDSKEWCGGNFDGLISRLPYIKDMGFDAVWITPPVKQVGWRDDYNGTGYHGYWAGEFTEVDEHLGGEEGLRRLADELHRMDMKLMVDVVANHVGPVHGAEDVGKFKGVLGREDGGQYNKLGMVEGESLDDYIKGPPGPPNAMTDAGDGCWPYYDFEEGVCDRTVVEGGWFGDLGDLNQTDVQVREYLLDWISWMQETFDVDGFRLDTALYIPRDFLDSFQDSAGVYIVGEVVTYNFTLHASYQQHLTGVLNFPMTERLGEVFNGSMLDFGDLYSESRKAAYSDRSLLGNFVDNHDGERFLRKVGFDVGLLKNALALTMLEEGIPIVYYGTENEGVAGNEDNRVGMWKYGYDGGTEVGEMMREMNAMRRKYGLGFGGEHAETEMEVLGVEDNWFVFSRGGLVAFINNVGRGKGGGKMCFGNVEWGEGLKVVYGEGGVEEGEGGVGVCVVVEDKGDPVVAARWW
ncbi:hypothetical protein TrRE_jg1344 [Triparma retinervis]|uniref:alpha-amylase n=1 Tax=Triparma retinervis TaxID=2557542 RepID=A0A9W7KS18_9STRA|nr:hypothetical protein TrRE_jg1344 [Triparma retinervis]